MAELTRKNAELERFTYTLSHDLKSPLVTVKTFLSYLEQDLAQQNSSRITQDMDYMRKATDKMVRLLDELLQMVRVGRVVNEPEPLNFMELVYEALTAVAGRIAERGVTMRVEEKIINLHGDRSRLAEIWQNLLENGVKYMGDQSEPILEVGANGEGEETVFFVRDNGIGIDPRYHEKIFSLFDQLDPAVEGTGLGLALVKRLVELYGGEIWVQSVGAGQGSTFFFTLPAAISRVPEGDHP
jgi:signal transduction histidine kinase